MSEGNAPTRLLPGPFVGRTYSLYGGAALSDGFFTAVAAAADACLSRWPDAAALVVELRRATKSRRALRRLSDETTPAGFALAEASRSLGAFMLDVDAHLDALSWWSRLGGTLGTTREQYLLYALEIELTNRICRAGFLQSATRLAFLPHCLRDHSAGCKAKKIDLDYACVSCSPRCYLNAVSRVLRRHQVRPYIWMGAGLGRTLREGAARPGGLAVLGIACVPELIAGMRKVARAGIPVLGLPLDANRCLRWVGSFEQTSVNLARLEALVTAPAP